VDRIRTVVSAACIRFDHGDAISVEAFVPHRQGVPSNTDYTLHVVLPRLMGWMEYDHVPPGRLRYGWKRNAQPGNLCTKDGFVYQKEVPYEECSLHGACGDRESLQKRGAHEKKDNEC
jgi:hypothetical protein